VAQPASVPAARRFVSDVLAQWGRDHVAEDVALCVSELATNATLHSDSPYFQVELVEHAGHVRLAVADAGMGSVDVLAREPEFSDMFLEELTADNASATGRGMLLVSALATEWGIDELPVGKRIWGQFEAAPTDGPDDESPTAAHLTWSAEREHPVLDPAEWPVVRFRGCPAALAVAHDQNLDDYTRELQLIGDRMGEPSFTKLADVLGGYVADHAPNWDPARIITREAVRDGREHVDFDVLADRDIRDSLTFLRRLIWEAEELSESGQLLTLPAAEPVQQLRDWMEGEFLAQIEDGADPLPYDAWLAGARQDVVPVASSPHA
jgi:anti-sigma regulatory factor (Ser/Thr protein kinase)